MKNYIAIFLYNDVFHSIEKMIFPIQQKNPPPKWGETFGVEKVYHLLNSILFHFIESFFDVLHKPSICIKRQDGHDWFWSMSWWLIFKCSHREHLLSTNPLLASFTFNYITIYIIYQICFYKTSIYLYIIDVSYYKKLNALINIFFYLPCKLLNKHNTFYLLFHNL